MCAPPSRSWGPASGVWDRAGRERALVSLVMPSIKGLSAHLGDDVIGPLIELIVADKGL